MKKKKKGKKKHVPILNWNVCGLSNKFSFYPPKILLWVSGFQKNLVSLLFYLEIKFFDSMKNSGSMHELEQS